MRRFNQRPRPHDLTMNSLKNLIQRCHQRHKKPLRQRKTAATPALDKGRPFHFTVQCAWKYPVRLYELEQADISFMPIGRAPHYEHGPRDFGGERFFRRQHPEDWNILLWQRSWGIQIYTGIPSECNDAQWHDIDFKYSAICSHPDAVFACIEALLISVANPLLTLTKSGGLRFSCRVQDYLHPNTDDAKYYIYKHTSTLENPYHRDVYLEILGESGYSRWDARYEILIGNLLDPPIVAKEVLFAPLNVLREALHEPTPSGEKESEFTAQTETAAPPSLGSYNLDLARDVFLRRGFFYVREDNSVHYWNRPGSIVGDGNVSLWEQEGGVWVRASTPNTGLPTEATLITDIWDDTGILSPLPATGLPVSEQMLAVREGKLSPLAVKRPSPVLRKPESTEKTYGTLAENATQMERVFNGNARILGLIAETGAGKNYAVESYVRNGGVISLASKPLLAAEAEQRFQKRNLSSFLRWKPRMHLWDQVKDIPLDIRIATPFQHGNVCEDPERCDTLEAKGGNPSESICPMCPVYTECQQHGYLSQLTTLKNIDAQILENPTLYLNPEYSEVREEILKSIDNTERLCIIDEMSPHSLFLYCRVAKETLADWRVNWQRSALGNFANALLHALEIKNVLNDNAVGRIRAVMHAFTDQEKMIVQQMCQVNMPGKVVARELVDNETGRLLARLCIEFEGGIHAYIPLDSNAADKLAAKGQPAFELDSFEVDTEVKIPMSMTQAIALGTLEASTVENIQAFPRVYQNPNWTLWHQLKRFFAYYTRDADVPMLWTRKNIQFWIPPVLHPSLKRLLFISSTLSEYYLRKAFPDEEIEVTHIKPTAWVPGNRVFQIRTGIYLRQAIFNYDTDWDTLGMSKTGQRFFRGISAEIEKDPNVQHAIITNVPTPQRLQHIAGKENVCLVTNYKAAERFGTTLEAAEVIWMVGVPHWTPGIYWRESQILFGNDEKPLCYEGETESNTYKDERVQSVYKQDVVGLLTQIIGRIGLNRLSNKTIVLLTAMPLPDITDRPETLLFDWEDFEIAGGLDKLPEVIAERQRFETERDNLTAESSRQKVEQVLGISKSQANRVLMKLRGGKIQRVPFHEQIHALLEGGEKTTAELIDAIDGHPGAVKNELKRLVDIGEIVKVRRAVYALPSE